MIINADGPQEQVEITNDAQVLAMDDLTEACDNEPEPAALLPFELVQIVPYPNFENL